MNQEIFDLAKKMAETDANCHLMEVEYRAALVHLEDVKKYLSEALFHRQEAGPLAIDLGAGKILVCVYADEGKYDFSIIRSFS
jgi:hypothetical protein